MKTVLESKGRIFAPRSSFNLRTALPLRRHCRASFFVEQGSTIVVLGSYTFGISSQMVKTFKVTQIFLKIMEKKKKKTAKLQNSLLESSVSSKKWTKTRRILVKTNSLAWQFAFEINWPLRELGYSFSELSNQSNEYRKWGFEWLINNITVKIKDTFLNFFSDKFSFFGFCPKLHKCETTYCTACPCIAAIEAKPIWFRKKY